MISKRSTWTAAFLLLLLASCTAQAGGRDFELGEAGRLWLPVPANWTVTGGDPVGPYRSWELEVPGSGGSLLMLTPTWGPPAEDPLRVALLAETARAAGNCIGGEPETFLQQGPEATVAWYACSDPEDTDSPEDFAHLLRAQVDVGPLRLSATLLHHQPDGELRQATLWLLANARYHAPPTDRLRLAGRPWSLRLPLEDFEVDLPTLREDQRGVMISGTHPETGLVVSAFIEQSEQRRTAEGWRDHVKRRLGKAPLPNEDMRSGEIAGHPALQYHVSGIGDVRIDQRHLHVFLVRDDTWIDVHVSKPEFQAGDESLLTDFVSAVRIEDDGAQP